MILLPAVDIRDDRAVRLRQGDYEQETVYADDPLEAARAWVAAGARWLHVVDLDGARAGEPASLGHLERMTRELDVPVQYGGGLRSVDAVRRALDAGAERVVLGTAAITDPGLLEEAVTAWPERLAVAVDVRDGKISVGGWTEGTEVTPEQLISTMQERGVRRFVYTSVDRDGTLEGVDVEAVRAVGETVEGSFVFSGGISTLDDLEALRRSGIANLEGVISGKALYERRFSVAEGQAALDGSG